MDQKIEHEKRVVAQMIDLYCRKKERNRTLCADCRELRDYAWKRLDNCRFGNRKGSCRHCKIHCYRPDMRARIRDVMRYAGPRMMWYDIVAVFRHLYSDLRAQIQKRMAG